MLRPLDNLEMCYIIQRLNLCSFLPNKVTKKSLEQFTDQMKKLGTYQKVRIELSINDNTKIPRV